MTREEGNELVYLVILFLKFVIRSHAVLLVTGQTQFIKLRHVKHI